MLLCSSAVRCVCCQVSSLQQFVSACSAPPSSTLSLNSLSAAASLTPTPSPLDSAVRGSPLSSSSGAVDGSGSLALSDSSIPNITPDLEQIISILYGDSGEGASLHKEPDTKQAKESATSN